MSQSLRSPGILLAAAFGATCGGQDSPRSGAQILADVERSVTASRPVHIKSDYKSMHVSGDGSSVSRQGKIEMLVDSDGRCSFLVTVGADGEAGSVHKYEIDEGKVKDSLDGEISEFVIPRDSIKQLLRTAVRASPFVAYHLIGGRLKKLGSQDPAKAYDADVDVVVAEARVSLKDHGMTLAITGKAEPGSFAEKRTAYTSTTLLDSRTFTAKSRTVVFELGDGRRTEITESITLWELSSSRK